VWKRAIAWAVALLVVGVGAGFLLRLIWPRTRRSRTSNLTP